jgi:hypothetical protein
MSYSISKINYFINASSLGNNRSQRGSIDFGIYEPSTEPAGAEPSFPTRVLEGPQVVFGDTTIATGSARIVLPSESNILQSTGLTSSLFSAGLGEQAQELPQNFVDALTYFSPERRRTREASSFASTFTTTRRGPS